MPLEVMVRRGHSIAKITNMMLRGSAPLVGPDARMGDHRSPAPGVDGISNHQTITIRLPDNHHSDGISNHQTITIRLPSAVSSRA
jgi:hypothetical protein